MKILDFPPKNVKTNIIQLLCLNEKCIGIEKPATRAERNLVELLSYYAIIELEVLRGVLTIW